MPKSSYFICLKKRYRRKEDGSLDIERINSLPLREFMEAIGDLTQEQYKDYISKLPINESMEPVRAITVD